MKLYGEELEEEGEAAGSASFRTDVASDPYNVGFELYVSKA
jgi:hypothetical protein